MTVGVTVLLPTRSVGRMLDQAVASVLVQRDVDLELLIVLDGPHRRSLPGWALDDRVRVHEYEGPPGLASVLNEGLRLTTSPVLARMDGDDICDPRRFGLQLAHLTANPEVGVVGSAAVVIDERGNTLGRRPVPASDSDIRRMLVVRNAFIHPSVMMRTDIVKAARGYAADAGTFQDYELWLRLALRTKMSNLGSELLRYRVHAAQHSKAAVLGRKQNRLIYRGRVALARSMGVGRRGQLAHGAWVARQLTRR